MYIRNNAAQAIGKVIINLTDVITLACGTKNWQNIGKRETSGFNKRSILCISQIKKQQIQLKAIKQSRFEQLDVATYKTYNFWVIYSQIRPLALRHIRSVRISIFSA